MTTDWRREAEAAFDGKVKPPGSLGRLEEWAVRLAALQETLAPRVRRGRVLVFAGDHGVTAAGVSPYPASVTPELLRLAAGGGGVAIVVLARSLGLEVELVDVGVDADLEGLAGIVHAKVRRGTRDSSRGVALEAGEVEAAVEAGREAVRRSAAGGVDAVGLGEVGIGNTTAAAALLSALTGALPEETVGRGSGVDDAGLEQKRRVVARMLDLHRDRLGTPMGAMAAVGGLELAAVAGAALEAPRHRIAVVVDGFISSVAVLAALREDPSIAPALFLAHRSAETGHRLALEALGGDPLLDLGMRLGEGTGAALALEILAASADLLRDMQDLADLGLPGDGEPGSGAGPVPDRAAEEPRSP